MLEIYGNRGFKLTLPNGFTVSAATQNDKPKDSDMSIMIWDREGNNMKLDRFDSTTRRVSAGELAQVITEVSKFPSIRLNRPLEEHIKEVLCGPVSIMQL